MGTYQHQFDADEELIDSETAFMPDIGLRMTERAARFAALARRYACAADFEAANRQRTAQDATLTVEAYMDGRRLDGQEEAVIADLVDAIRARLGAREYSVERGCLEEAAVNLRYAVAADEQRRAEDLDAPAAAASDERYSRMVDDGLIGRSHLMPEGVE